MVFKQCQFSDFVYQLNEIGLEQAQFRKLAGRSMAAGQYLVRRRCDVGCISFGRYPHPIVVPDCGQRDFQSLSCDELAENKIEVMHMITHLITLELQVTLLTFFFNHRANLFELPHRQIDIFSFCVFPLRGFWHHPVKPAD